MTRLSTGNQSLEEELADWRQKVESLENTNFDLQERLVAIGSLVEAVRSEISDYCPSADETLCEVEGKVEEEEEKVEYRIQENLIEGRLQLVMTGCSRITEDLSTLQHERDELQMVSIPFYVQYMCAHTYLHNVPILLAIYVVCSLHFILSSCTSLTLPTSLPFPSNLPLPPLLSLVLSYLRA